ncbi:MAG: HAMP domain-containing protein [Bdellovibrionales bacterium]
MIFGKSRRKFKNILISPDTQIHYGALFLALSTVINVVFTIMGSNIYYASVNGTMEQTNSFPMYLLFGSCIALYVLIYAFAFILGLIVTHKVFGPLVPIQRFLTEIKNGNYSSRIQLRTKDEPRLQEIAKSLNELAEFLEKK